MNNPFESGHIKNYILLYASVVVIMILFFIAATLFRDTDIIETKIFNVEINEDKKVNKLKEMSAKNKEEKTIFKLMEVNPDSEIQHNKN